MTGCWICVIQAAIISGFMFASNTLTKLSSHNLSGLQESGNWLTHPMWESLWEWHGPNSAAPIKLCDGNECLLIMQQRNLTLTTMAKEYKLWKSLFNFVFFLRYFVFLMPKFSSVHSLLKYPHITFSFFTVTDQISHPFQVSWNDTLTSDVFFLSAYKTYE
jgi:hypothetical protein